jgi:hypothetical protein
MKPIIRVENVSKRYRIGGSKSHTSRRYSLAAAARARLSTP